MNKVACIFFADSYTDFIYKTFRASTGILSMCLLVLSIYGITDLQVGNGQVENAKRYFDPGNKFSFSYPPNWSVTTRYIDESGFSEVTLLNPNSSRMKVSVVYTPKDALLQSPTGKPTAPSRALTNLEQAISEEYVSFNSTGKFPHKYSVKGLPSASDLVDFEKIEGKPGKMLIVYSKATNEDSLVFIYSESKRSFYKSLSHASQIINSISITSSNPFTDLFQKN